MRLEVCLPKNFQHPKSHHFSNENGTFLGPVPQSFGPAPCLTKPPSGSGAKIIMSSSWSSCALREPAVMHGIQGFFLQCIPGIPLLTVYPSAEKATMKSSKIPRSVGEKCLASMVVNNQATPPEKTNGQRKKNSDIYGPKNDRHLFLAAPKFWPPSENCNCRLNCSKGLGKGGKRATRRNTGCPPLDSRPQGSNRRLVNWQGSWHVLKICTSRDWFLKVKPGWGT